MSNGNPEQTDQADSLPTRDTNPAGECGGTDSISDRSHSSGPVRSASCHLHIVDVCSPDVREDHKRHRNDKTPDITVGGL